MKFAFVAFLLILTYSIYGQDLLWHAYSDGQMFSNEYCYVQADPEGNVIHCGLFTDTTSFVMPFDTVTYSPQQDSVNTCMLRKMSADGLLMWQVVLETDTGSIVALGLEVDDAGNSYIFGWFKGLIDFDYGPGEMLVEHGQTNHGYLAKYSPAGEPLWVKSFLTDNYVSVQAAAITTSGEVYVGGSYSGDIDLDPGIAEASYTNNFSFPDSYMVKLDAAGNYVWSYTIVGPSSGSDSFTELEIGPDGNIYGAGQNKLAFDIDPGPGTTTIPGNNSVAAFIFCISPNMELQFGYPYGGSGSRRITSICFDDDANVYVSGEYSAIIDADLQSGTTNLQAVTSLNDNMIAKYNSDMQLIWAKQLGGLGADRLLNLVVDGDGTCYGAGSFSNHSTDYDPGPETYILEGDAYGMPVIFKLNSNGDFQWARRLISNDTGRAAEISKSIDGRLYVTGWISAMANADLQDGYVEIPQPNLNGFYILALEENVCSAMSVLLNETEALDCALAGSVTATPYAGSAPYNFAWTDFPDANSEVLPVDAPGLFTAEVTDATGCTFNQSIYVEGPIADTLDAVMSIASGPFVPGFDNQLYLTLDALGCSTISGSVQLVLDSGLTYLSSLPAPNAISGDTLTWNYNNLTHDNSITISVAVNTSLGYISGDTIPIAAILQANEANENADNNSLLQHYTVVSSYDPNMIVVQPEGYTEAGFVLAGDVLTYTIHFQNTGDYYASFIAIRDTLSEHLKLSTLNLLNSSHPCEVQLLENHVVNFWFDGIWLPGAFDEPASHGYITFSIQIEDDAPMLSEMSNRVGIYFDYNPPIITNTVLNTIFECSMMASSFQDNYLMTIDNIEEINPQSTYAENTNWFIGEELISTSPTYTPGSLQPGNYTFTVETTNPLCTSTYDFELQLIIPIPACPGDFDEDGIVTVLDLIIYMGEFGCTSNCSADNTGDGQVTVADLNTLLEWFGVICGE